MAGGAPRTVTPPPEEMIKLGEEMVKWVLENNPTHLSHWYVLEKGITRKDFKNNYKPRAEFAPYYDKAMTIIGKRYLECDGIDKGISNRWQRIYFPDLAEEEDEKAKFLANLNKEDVGLSMSDMVTILRENGYLDKVDDKDKS